MRDLVYGIAMAVTLIVGVFAFIVVGWICRDEPRSEPWPPERLPPPPPLPPLPQQVLVSYDKPRREPLALPRGDQ